MPGESVSRKGKDGPTHQTEVPVAWGKKKEAGKMRILRIGGKGLGRGTGFSFMKLAVGIARH